MMEMDEAWNAYFQELEPGKRLALLQELTEPEEARDFCRTLYQLRYADPKDPVRQVDRWLWKLIYLPGLFQQKKLRGRTAGKELAAMLRDLHLEEAEPLTELRETILYREYRNTCRRYLSTCGGDRYASTLFGFKKARDEDKRKKAGQEVWMASRGLALAADEPDRLRLWCDALRDELADWDPNSGETWAEMEQMRKK